MGIGPHAAVVAPHDRISIARWRWLAVTGALIQATWMVVGCGSTSPVAPSPSANPAQSAVRYPALLGEWGGGGTVSVRFVDSASPTPYGCDAEGHVSEQTGGVFSASIGLNGRSINTDKECGDISITFTAQMTPDGTIRTFEGNGSFGSFECLPISTVVFQSGSASDGGFGIQLTDQAQCKWPPLVDPRYPRKDAVRTLSFGMYLRRNVPSPSAPVM